MSLMQQDASGQSLPSGSCHAKGVGSNVFPVLLVADWHGVVEEVRVRVSKSAAVLLAVRVLLLGREVRCY